MRHYLPIVAIVALTALSVGSLWILRSEPSASASLSAAPPAPELTLADPAGRPPPVSEARAATPEPLVADAPSPASEPAVAAARSSNPDLVDPDTFARNTRSGIYPRLATASASEALTLFAACRQLRDNACARAARARSRELGE